MTAQPKDLMAKKMIGVPEGTSLLQAIRTMNEKNIRHLPVISTSTDEIIGLLSKTDVIAAREYLDHNVELAMTSPVESVAEDAPLRTAVMKMLDKKISSLIVTDAAGEAVGILTAADLLFHMAEMLDEQNKPKWYEKISLPTVGQIMSRLSDAGI